MEQQTKQNFSSVDTWIRLLYMLVFAVLLWISRLVIFAVAVLQAILVLINGEDNKNLRDLGQIAAKWSLQVFYFLTFNSNQKPFPFDDWPELETSGNDAIEPDSASQDTLPESGDVSTKTDQ